MNRTLAVCLFLLAAPACVVAAEEVFPGYLWQEIGDGVYLHSQTDPLAGPVDGNSVVIVYQQGVVVVDTHINPAAARALIGKLGEITDKPVTHVVNTHWHDDHTNGNHAFREAYPEARFVAHRETLAALRKEWAAMEKQRKAAYASLTAEKVLAAAGDLEASDPQKAISYRVYAGYVAALKPELPTLQLVYPDTAFEEEFVIGSGERSVVVEWLGRGNTVGDAVVWLPDARILITGDLLTAPIPFAFDAPMSDWIDTLEQLLEKDAAVIVPGHGTAQHDDEYAQQVRLLLRTTIDAVGRARDEGSEFQDLADTVDLEAIAKAFTGGDARLIHAWNAYYFDPGIKSAWVALGYPAPEID